MLSVYAFVLHTNPSLFNPHNTLKLITNRSTAGSVLFSFRYVGNRASWHTIPIDCKISFIISIVCIKFLHLYRMCTPTLWIFRRMCELFQISSLDQINYVVFIHLNCFNFVHTYFCTAQSSPLAEQEEVFFISLPIFSNKFVQLRIIRASVCQTVANWWALYIDSRHASQFIF